MPGGLAFTRYYNSSPINADASMTGAIGARWTHTYDMRLNALPNTRKETCYIRQDNNKFYCDYIYQSSIAPSAVIIRPDGKQYRFSKSGTAWPGDADVNDRLTATYGADGVTVTGWTYITAAGDATERYDAVGRLTSITNRSGLTQVLTYSDGKTNDTSVSRLPVTAPACRNVQAGMVLHAERLLCVTDNWGRQLQFEYDDKGRIVKLIDPANQAYTYEYDGPSTGCAAYDQNNMACKTNNLTKVTYPDGASRVYYYNEAAQINGGSACSGQTSLGNGLGPLPNALTGLIDEKGVRYASWTYDCTARATSSQHAGGVEKVLISYGAISSPTTNTVTHITGTASNSQTTVRNYSYYQLGGTSRIYQIDQPCVECGDTKQIGYGGDSNGIYTYGVPLRRKYWNDYTTCYAYDFSRNLETARVEGTSAVTTDNCISIMSAASLAAPLRKISTRWHTQYRLPVAIAEPKKQTTLVYDDRGNLLAKTEQASMDDTGVQGFNATLIGMSRTWSYTYNAVGQTLTATDPLGNVTSYAYDNQGNLTTITDALGKVTTLSMYDANGRAGRIVDANGMTTDLTYNLRGWLTSKTVTAAGIHEVTNYDYDSIGQMIKMTLPDGSSINYNYDDAHRLTDMMDSAGNSIHYTLDLRGNRIKEEVRASGGYLARQSTRIFDSLNRVIQVTGGEQ